MKIAALYVAKGGSYYGLPDVDPWDEDRDARKYAGPYPVAGARVQRSRSTNCARITAVLADYKFRELYT